MLRAAGSASGTANITGGTINGATIGGTAPAAGTFTQVNLSAGGSQKVTANGLGLNLDGGAINLMIGGVTGWSLNTNGHFVGNSRFEFKQGATVASTANLVLGSDGNRFQVSGTTTINLIDATNWQGGSLIVLHFQGVLTVTHNAAASGNNKPIFLIAGVNLATAAKKQVTLQYDSVDSTWYQIA